VQCNIKNSRATTNKRAQSQLKLETTCIQLISYIEVSLTWPNTTTGVTLKNTDKLSVPIQWTIVTNIPADSDGQFVITLSPVTANRFFALSRDDSFQPVWTSLGGYLTSSPSATSLNPGNLEIVYRGDGEKLYYLALDDGVWSSANLSGSLASIPAITSLKMSDTAAVFLRDQDDSLLRNNMIQELVGLPATI
jgi:hypothetical protein